MKTFLFIIIFCILLSCSRKSKKTEPLIQRSVYYLYDQERFFKRDTTIPPFTYIKNMIRYSNLDPAIEKEVRWAYVLVHMEKDILFKKHLSYLDSIQYYDSEWIEQNVGNLWEQSDTVKIYMIEKIEKTDSIAFYYVRRSMISSE